MGHTWAGSFRVGALGFATLFALVSTPRGHAEEPQQAPRAEAAVDDPMLGSDPSLVTGTLDNGLRYVVRRAGNPQGRISLWLHVHAGSLAETEQQRGIAHYLEHMAFNGSANFPPGSVVPYFESLGLTFGRDQNAFTSHEQTTYQLALPDVSAATIGKGVLFLADVASRLALDPAEIDAERQIILEEKRARGGSARRVQDLVDGLIAPASTYGRRAPIGTEQSIQALTKSDFVAFYTHWYVPSNMTVLAVGDCDEAMVVAEIRKAFGGAKSTQRPARPEIGAVTNVGRRAIVATDPELTSGDLSFVSVLPSEPPTTTRSLLRRELAETLATRAFTRRLGRRTLEAKARVLGGEASIREISGVIRMVQFHTRVVPTDWRKGIADMGSMLQAVRTYGFTERDLAIERAGLIAEAEEALSAATTRPARAMIDAMNRDVTAGEPILSEAQRLAWLRDLLPKITPAEVTARFAVSLDPANLVIVAKLPAGRFVPTEAELLSAADGALSATPEDEPEGERPTELLSALPAAGTYVESSLDGATGVWSGWLSNGVRVHHRFMDQLKNDVSVRVTLAGGAILESSIDCGTAAVGGLAWERLSAGAMSSADVRDLMVGKKVRMQAALGDDAMSFTVSGDPSDLEEGLKLAHLLFTVPTVEPRAFGGWQQSQRQAIAARQVTAAGTVAEAFASIMLPDGEVRMRPFSAFSFGLLGARRATGWMRALVASGPIEVAVVGDISQARAAALVAKYMGSLPSRPRITDARLDGLRRIPREEGPIDIVKKIEVSTPESVVMVGFFRPDATQTKESRALGLAARILTTRMTKSVREERQLVYSIRAALHGVPAYPGWSTFVAQAPTAPGKGDTLADVVDQLFDEFAKEGPTAAELDVARTQAVKQFDLSVKSPRFWLDVLDTLDYRGVPLSDVLDESRAVQAMTADEIRDVFAKCCVPANRFRFVVSPKSE